MQILLLDRDPTHTRRIRNALVGPNREFTACRSLEHASAALSRDYFALVVLEATSTTAEAFDLCRFVRGQPTGAYSYVVVTSPDVAPADEQVALDAGADDLLPRPCSPVALRRCARLAERLEALSQAARDQQIVPICMGCNSIRDAEGQWEQVALERWENVRFSHGYCPPCFEREMQRLAALPWPVPAAPHVGAAHPAASPPASPASSSHAPVLATSRAWHPVRTR